MIGNKKIEISDNFNKYPHYVYATAYLVEGKLADYKICDRERSWNDRTFRGCKWESDILKNLEDNILNEKITCEYKKILVSNNIEHNDAFNILELWLDSEFEKYEGNILTDIHRYRFKNNKKKVMISQPMKGKEEEQIRIERASLVTKLENEGFSVVDTIFTSKPPKGCNEAIWYLSKSIEMIGQVDYVMFMKGWENARGCRIENKVCQEYGKQTLYERISELIEKGE